MSKNSETKTAAILFADIAGYTAFMQKNEEQALLQLQHFKQVLERVVPSCQGRIVQFYGDGCLVIFDHAKQAVTCAKVLQETFREGVEVPVRIGLHQGEVLLKDGNVYGHTVNVASRIESMGVAGAVLMSSRIWYSIKNDAAFKFSLLGKFKFKNVEGPMSVYALANKGFYVPKRKEIQGKFAPTENNNQYRFLYWLLPSLLAGGLGFLLWQSTTQDEQIDNKILKERIAVLPFKNNTNDERLNVLGEMAADWINTGLMEIGEAEVVSPFTVRTHEDAIGVLENDPQNRPSYAQLTGAQNLITGSYYKAQKDIIFKLKLVDARSGQLRFSFKEIRGSESNKENIINELRSQVMGYWAAREMVDSKKMKAPNFKAYELYLRSLRTINTERTYQEILEIDSTFYLARIQYLFLNRAETHGKNLPSFEFFERHKNNLSEYEKAWVTHLKAVYLGQLEVAFNSLNEIRIKYPKDFMLNHITATTALEGLNNPALALAIYEELPLDEKLSASIGLYYNYRINNIVVAYIQLNKIPEAMAFMKTVSLSPIKNASLNYYMRTIMYEALLSKDEEKLATAYEKLKTVFKRNPFPYFLLSVNLTQSNFITEDFRKMLEKDMVTFYNQLPPNNIQRALWQNMIARMTGKMELLNINNLSHLPKAFQIGNLSAAGRLYAREKQIDSVKTVIKKLQNLTTPDYSAFSQVGAGSAYYFMARLQVYLGTYEDAIESLKQARALGAETRLMHFQYDWNLKPLFDFPEFKSLLQPIWPASDNAQVKLLAVKQYRAASEKIEDVTAAFQERKEIQLASGDRFFNLTLSTSNNFNMAGLTYHYKINGVDEEWSVADKNILTISGLPYGQQTLSIKALFPNGRFTKEILEVPVYVAKPFYLTIWFLIASLAFIFSGIYLWTKRLKKQKDILEEEVVRRTQKIEQQAEELRQLDKMKSNFFANMSHELRTPLTLILSPISKLLKEEKLSDNGLKLLNMIQQNGQNMYHLVDEIMDLTKLEAKKVILKEEPVIMYPFLERLVNTFDSYAQKKKIALSLLYKANTHLQLNLDKSKFEKILNNLISNALKFTPENGTVTVLFEDLGHVLQLEVTDNGAGIHPDDLPHVFDRYYQTKQANTSTQGGTGIGLALVQELVKLFEGEIKVESERGQGTNFIVNFPKKQILKQLDEQEIAAIAALSNKEIPIGKQSNGFVKESIEQVSLQDHQESFDEKPKLLVVEDNRQLREYIQILLGDTYHMVTATNGQEALDWLAGRSSIEELPDLVISDLMMPILDGFQLLTALKNHEKFRAIPTIMLTARADMQDKLTALRIGVDDYMIKPFVEEELQARVANLLQNAKEKKDYSESAIETAATNTVALSNPMVAAEQIVKKTPAEVLISSEDLAWLSEVEKKVLAMLSDFDFTLDRLSTEIYLSPRQIRRRLKKITGLSFSQYLREARFREARHLLETKKVRTIKKLAYEIGMKDVKYFSQQFKQHFGKSPSEYLLR